MGKRSKILVSIAASAVFLSASPAWAQNGPVPVNETTLYSDASKTTVVGYISFQNCTYDGVYDGVQYRLFGTYTYHQEDRLIGYCYQGDFSFA